MGDRKSSRSWSHDMKRVLFVVFVTSILVAACIKDSCGCTTVPDTAQVIASVTGPDNQPIANVTVELKSGTSSRFVETTVQGSAFFETLPGSYTVTVHPPTGRFKMAAGQTAQRQIDLIRGEVEFLAFKLDPL
jgi:hypothetical protein